MFNFQTLEKKETKSSKKEDDETKSTGSFDDEIGEISKPVNLEDDTTQTNAEEDEHHDEENGKSTKKNSKHPYIEIIPKREQLIFELGSGNNLYYF